MPFGTGFNSMSMALVAAGFEACSVMPVGPCSSHSVGFAVASSAILMSHGCMHDGMGLTSRGRLPVVQALC
jgi:hypothetical protein